MQQAAHLSAICCLLKHCEPTDWSHGLFTCWNFTLMVAESSLRVCECGMCSYIAWGCETRCSTRTTGTWKKSFCSRGVFKFVYCSIWSNNVLKSVLRCVCDSLLLYRRAPAGGGIVRTAKKSLDWAWTHWWRHDWGDRRKNCWEWFTFLCRFLACMQRVSLVDASIRQPKLRTDFENRHLCLQKSDW